MDIYVRARFASVALKRLSGSFSSSPHLEHAPIVQLINLCLVYSGHPEQDLCTLRNQAAAYTQQ